MKKQTFQEAVRLDHYVRHTNGIECDLCQGYDWHMAMVEVENAALEIIAEILNRPKINCFTCEEPELRLLAAELIGRARRGEDWREVIDSNRPQNFIQDSDQ